MIDAAKYDTTATLRSGMAVRVRSIRPDDKKRLVEAFKNLDPESIYTRFFYHKKMLTEEELKSATELDFENAVALVVTTGEGERETIIGAGRYAVIDGTFVFASEIKSILALPAISREMDPVFLALFL